jgi:hypothetical protein
MVQVKYEMVRRVTVDGAPVTAPAAAFGYSRPSPYQAACSRPSASERGRDPADQAVSSVGSGKRAPASAPAGSSALSATAARATRDGRRDVGRAPADAARLLR